MANVAIGEINQFVANPGTPAHRVGIFNDGYLGSHNDLGTYRNREIETTWLSHQGLHTLFGGEAVAPHASPTFPWTEQNDVAHATEEMFITRTSYLNILGVGKCLIYGETRPIKVLTSTIMV